MSATKQAAGGKYLGYRPHDHATPYAKFFNETINAPGDDVRKAIAQSPLQAGDLPPLNSLPKLLKKGYTGMGTGYTLEPDGSARIAALINMPGVTPAMWQWWFGWHGCMANRYKLWHPKAHVSAQWKDGDQSLQAYIGRTSMIEEYIGGKLEKASIRFVNPDELGIGVNATAGNIDECFICARIGFTGFPLDFGWLMHQVSITAIGAEMRSRFWIGGEHIQLRTGGMLGNLVSPLIRKVRTVNARQAEDLLVHCIEEMNHLAGFLPQLYYQFNQVAVHKILAE